VFIYRCALQPDIRKPSSIVLALLKCVADQRCYSMVDDLHRILRLDGYRGAGIDLFLHHLFPYSRFPVFCNKLYVDLRIEAVFSDSERLAVHADLIQTNFN
jgi:hypothetical protein